MSKPVSQPSRSAERFNYICVSCGQEVAYLYYEIDSVIILANCKACLDTADKYIEYDNVLNLMPLCANHHKEFQKYELAPDELLKDKKLMIDYLIKKSVPNHSITVE